MNSLYRLLLSLSLAATGLLGLQGPASAVETINANICAINDLSPGPGISRDAHGITNFAAGFRNVQCPLVRVGAAPANGYSVYVDGSIAANTSMTCALSSYDYTNRFLGQASLFVNNPGNFDILLTLPALQVPTYSHQTLSCAIPHFGSLFDIEPTTP